jgi:hypothetical protein
VFFLQTNGSGVLSFSSPSSDFVLLATTTASSSSSISFDGYFSSTYKNYKMIFSGVRMSTTNTEFRARVRTSNADITSSIYKTASNLVASDSSGGGSVQGGYGGWNFTYIPIQRGTSNGATYEGAGQATIFDPLSTTGYKQVQIEMQHIWQDISQIFAQQQYAQCDTTSALSGISFFPASGNITSGTFKLYGLK